MASTWLRRAGPRRALLAGLVAALLGVLGWLGWRVLEQDRQLAVQRRADDREIAADVVAAALGQRLSAIERDLDTAAARPDAPLPFGVGAGAVVARLSNDHIRSWPEHRLRYVPELPPRRGDAAADALVESAQRSLKTGDYAAALDAYDRLQTFGDVPIGDVVGGIPAGLFAHLGRLTVHERQGDSAARRREARALWETLRAATWPVSAATYQFLVAEQVDRVLGESKSPDPQLVLAEAVAWLWDQRIGSSAFPPSGRESRTFDSGTALLVWRPAGGGVVSFVENQDALAGWIASLEGALEARGATVSLATQDGRPVVGRVSAGERPTARLPSQTALPWTIQITDDGGTAASSDRQRLLVASMAVLFALVIAGAWLIERTAARQLAVADLQSDFVSAVSHEFRTPLTSLVQLSELLMRGRVASEDDRARYYELLHAESQRLRRLVETLLTFGRLEAGRMEFRFDTVDPAALVETTVNEFGASPQAFGHRVELRVDGPSIALRGDRDVLRTVVWNLLENAAKYSPDCDTIWVSLAREADSVALRVRDRGVGIPRNEQRTVFDTFVRGAGARASGVGGSGVGLAIARRIVQAHGGEITLDSEPGRGSTFTVTLPARTEAPETRVLAPASADASARR
jgi:signal transduction histidine kinase